MSQWKAAADKVIVAVDRRPTTTPGGIVLPEKAKAKVMTGTVLAAGPEAKNVLPQDVVYFQFDGSTELVPGTDDTSAVRSMHVDYVLGILRNTYDER